MQQAPHQKRDTNRKGTAIAVGIGLLLVAIALPWPSIALAAIAAGVAAAVFAGKISRGVSASIRRLPKDERGRNIRAAGIDLAAAIGLGLVAVWSISLAKERHEREQADERRRAAELAEAEHRTAEEAEAARLADEARKARLREKAPAGIVEAEKLSAQAVRLREDGDWREALSKMLAARGVASVFAEVSDDAVAFLAKTEKPAKEMSDSVAVMDGAASARGRLQRARDLTEAKKYIDADDELARALGELPQVEAGSEHHDEVENVRSQIAKLRGMLAPKVAKARKDQAAEAAAAKPSASASSRADALVVANDLGVGAKGADLIEKIATRYGVAARDVADKAAKAAELCDGGIGHVSGALVFAEGTSRTKEQREVVPLDDAFVLYVAQGCPT